jgi:hypothetical protein
MKRFLTVVALALAGLTAAIAAVPGTASAAVRTTRQRRYGAALVGAGIVLSTAGSVLGNLC